MNRCLICGRPKSYYSFSKKIQCCKNEHDDSREENWVGGNISLPKILERKEVEPQREIVEEENEIMHKIGSMIKHFAIQLLIKIPR